MAYTHTRIFSVVDEEFDRAFDASLPIMTDPVRGTYPFAEMGLTTYEAQKAKFREMVEHWVSQPNAFCWKSEEDGLLLTLIFGTATNGVMDLYVWLSAENANGSRSYVYDRTYGIGFHTWLKEQGITSIRSHMAEKGSRLKDFTHNAMEPIQDVTGDWGTTEENRAQPEGSPYAAYTQRVFSVNSTSNIPTNTD